MKVVRADVMGLCFGVRDALKVIDAVVTPTLVTIHGQLVHNEVVLSDLASRGFAMNGEDERTAVPATPVVLITAHGVSDRHRERLAAGGKTVVDTTCPLVKQLHQSARSLEEAGYHVLVVGLRRHVEVQGIVEDLCHFDVIETAEEVRTYPSKRLGVVCQTTTAVDHAERVKAAVVARNPGAEVRFVDTICHPTKDHQKALDRLMNEVDAMVVVGGMNSNNTRQLVLRCQARGLRAYHVQGPEDLRPEWFNGVESVGLTAGTSTLDQTIAAVEHALQHISQPLSIAM